jgi:uncharacterized protein YacL
MEEQTKDQLVREKQKAIVKLYKNAFLLFVCFSVVYLFDIGIFLTIIATIYMFVAAIKILSNLIKSAICTSRINKLSGNYSYKKATDDLNDIFAELEEKLKKQQQQKQQERKVLISNSATINAYKLLKVSKTDDVPMIKKAYRTFAKEWHPDKFTNDTDENKAISIKNIQRLNNAYALIKKDKNFN